MNENTKKPRSLNSPEAIRSYYVRLINEYLDNNYRGGSYKRIDEKAMRVINTAFSELHKMILAEKRTDQSEELQKLAERVRDLELTYDPKLKAV